MDKGLFRDGFILSITNTPVLGTANLRTAQKYIRSIKTGQYRLKSNGHQTIFDHLCKYLDQLNIHYDIYKTRQMPSLDKI